MCHSQSRWAAVFGIMSREDMVSFLSICKTENIHFQMIWNVLTMHLLILSFTELKLAFKPLKTAGIS